MSDRIFVGHSTVGIAVQKRAAQIAALHYQCEPTDYNAHRAAVAAATFFSMVETQSTMVAVDTRTPPERLESKLWRMWKLQADMAAIMVTMLPNPDEHRRRLRDLMLQKLP